MALHAQARKLARHYLEGLLVGDAAASALKWSPGSATETRNGELGFDQHHAKADWQFTTHHARVKLKRLYPQFE
jgi:hypothetical protein